jgi:gamma-glutamyltranspeptidase/glutathione hydrolase
MASGMVVCPEPLAAQAGADILSRGGNAMDAATGASFVQGVVNPLLCGLGGSGVATVFWAERKEKTCLRFWGTAGEKASPDIFASDFLGQEGAVTRYKVRNNRNKVGYESIVVPGFLSGIHTCWKRYGSGNMTWAELLEPSIRLAQNGFDVYPYLYRSWQPGKSTFGGDSLLRITKSTEDIYTHAGSVYEVGEKLVQSEYGNTLSRISTQGPGLFYKGEIAQTIATDMVKHKGLITFNDLSSYQPLLDECLIGNYRGYEVLTDLPPGCGILLIELLNILEGWNLTSMGWNTPGYLDKLARAMNMVFADRARYMADPRFNSIPIKAWISKQYAEELRAKIDSGEDLSEQSFKSVGGKGTTHISVIDGEGNCVSLTHTLGYCSGIVTQGLGFLYNNDMQGFDPQPGNRNSIQPGKMPVNGGAPTILLKDGAVSMVIGSPAGARKLTAMTQAIVNVLDFGMDMQTAVSVERIHSEDERKVIVVEPTFPKDLCKRLEEMGINVKIDPYTARLSAIWRDPVTGNLEGGADPRGGGGLARMVDR